MKLKSLSEIFEPYKEINLKNKTYKNCLNCIHLETETEDFEGHTLGSYYVCNKRYEDESIFEKLQESDYLNRSKKCCELTKTGE